MDAPDVATVEAASYARNHKDLGGRQPVASVPLRQGALSHVHCVGQGRGLPFDPYDQAVPTDCIAGACHDRFYEPRVRWQVTARVREHRCGFRQTDDREVAFRRYSAGQPVQTDRNARSGVPVQFGDTLLGPGQRR
jgi:hypothetical protein